MWGALDGHARGARGDGDPRSIATLMCDTLVERVTGIRIDPLPATGADTDDHDHTGTGAPRGGVGVAGGSGCGPAPWPVDPDPWDTTVADPYQHHTSSGDAERASAQGEGCRPARPGWGEESAPRTRVELQVVLAASTLLGLDDQPGMLRGYGTIPAALARQLADQVQSSVLRRLICDPVDGRLLGMDTGTRCYQGSARQFTRWRDQACRLSGADIKTLDHILPFADDGPTTVHNAQGLAKNPHLLRDHPDIKVRTVAYHPDPGADPDPHHLHGHAQLARLHAQAPDVTWRMPTGHTYRRPPPPALGHGSRPVPPDRQQRRRRHGTGRDTQDDHDP